MNRPWLNHKLQLKERVKSLLDRMTLREKISQLTDKAPAIKRLGLKKICWGGEALHGLCKTGEATQFPMPIAMGATFDPSLIQDVASAVSDEARAKYHDKDWSKGPYSSLIFYTPVINILRDPRWGRAQETYGEDPFLVSEMGAAFVRGLQGNDKNILKTAACAKHLAVASGPERLRQTFNARVNKQDLSETFLPAFHRLVREKVATVMATYNRVNGEHCCASPTLIQHYIRDTFGFQGMVLSDGDALKSLHTTHKVTLDKVETAAVCLISGCDHEIGVNAFPYAGEAIKRGLIDEGYIDRALMRVLALRFKTGEFDPPARNPWKTIKADVIRCDKHLELARKTAEKSIVLLKNNGILPLKKPAQGLLVTGPTAGDIQCLLGNFYRGVSPELKTILEGITATAPKGTCITHMQGSFLTHPNLFPSEWTVGYVRFVDVTICCIGYSPLMEGEDGECIGAPHGGDKKNLSLPENQLKLLRDLKKAGKPVVTVVTGGSPLDLREVHKLSDAVLMAWYPGEQGGTAVGNVIWGKVNPSGRLPVTFPAKLSDVPAFTDYDMKKRTYRYNIKKPLYSFGFGLSYTSFKYSSLTLSRKSAKAGNKLMARIKVTNSGKIAGEEVLQLYISCRVPGKGLPKYSLKALKRIRLGSGKSKTLSFPLKGEMFKTADDRGEMVIRKGKYDVYLGGSSPLRGTAAGTNVLKASLSLI